MMTDENKNSEWDLENAERRPGVKNPRAIVSVAFARHEFESVVECAEHYGKKLSEFIRDAALEKVEQRNQVISIERYGHGEGSFHLEAASGLSTYGSITRLNDVEAKLALSADALT